jgi:hypothetical protein
MGAVWARKAEGFCGFGRTGHINPLTKEMIFYSHYRREGWADKRPSRPDPHGSSLSAPISPPDQRHIMRPPPRSFMPTKPRKLPDFL